MASRRAKDDEYATIDDLRKSASDGQFVQVVKQLAESEKRSKAERDERRRERDGPDADAPRAEKPKPAPKEKPAKKSGGEFNALEAQGNDAAFPGLPGVAKAAAAGGDADAES